MTPEEEITAQWLRQEAANRAANFMRVRGQCLTALSTIAHHDRLVIMNVLRADVDANLAVANGSTEEPR